LLGIDEEVEVPTIAAQEVVGEVAQYRNLTDVSIGIAAVVAYHLGVLQCLRSALIPRVQMSVTVKRRAPKIQS